MAKPPKASVTRAREARAWELSVRGKSSRQIAAILGEEGLGPVSFQAVARLLRVVGARKTAALTEEISDYKARQAALLALLISESLGGWDRSQRPAIERRVKDVVIDGRIEGVAVELPAKEITRTTKWRDGTPQFLAEARAAAADIRKLFGLDATPSDPPAGQGDPDPAAARRALMAAETEPEPAPGHEPDPEDQE